ncbi:NERD domain-containing protein [Marinobacterium maritimum]|uniref:NERD domain-containing protein n=2 Tax=Marinobacterium maritimum TaxID=500162 RepID=A0ABP3TFW7_9GAMM
MDFVQIISNVLTSFWYLIPLFILAGVLNAPWFKGVMGEFIVNLSARYFLDKSRYRLIKNVTLPSGDGTTQIDHVIVSVFGVFVVETKNMKGWIFGGQHQKQWTQRIFKHSSKFQNPLHQNYKHVKALEQLLGLEESQLHSVVVFVGDSTFKTPMPDNVTRGFGYVKYIKSKTEPLLSDEQVEDIIQQIETGRYPRSLSTNRQHVKHVKNIVEAKANQVTCPKCGSDMVQREVKKGARQGQKFWGCSRFPSCRGILNLN